MSARFHNGAQGNAIVLALEGLKWLLGQESVVTKRRLQHEWQDWLAYYAEERAAGRYAPPEKYLTQ